ncbi:MAG: type II toxin-antitoxin system VapC family toxin [Acidobacteriaceae bacterium]|nr:type II toxin-antitoxin system VapC family toxin [Acidobacteriaceae bacterium]
MIIVDTSALLAILYGESEAPAFVQVLDRNEAGVPASVLVEGGILAIARGKTQDWDRLIQALAPEIIAIDEPIAMEAVHAYRRFGKGRHKAALNFGDCLVYATAKHLRVPLLCNGRNFVHTDLHIHKGTAH